MVAHQKKFHNIFLEGGGVKKFWDFSLENHFMQFHFTRQTTVEQISCQHHK